MAAQRTLKNSGPLWCYQKREEAQINNIENRLRDHAARIGVLLRLETVESGVRVLIDSTADLVFDEMIVDYLEEEMRLRIIDDPMAASKAWRRLGIIVGCVETEG